MRDAGLETVERSVADSRFEGAGDRVGNVGEESIRKAFKNN